MARVYPAGASIASGSGTTNAVVKFSSGTLVDSLLTDDGTNVTLASAAQLLWSTDTGLQRTAAGVLKATDGSTGIGAINLGELRVDGSIALDATGLTLLVGSGGFTEIRLPSAASLTWSTDTGLKRAAAALAQMTDGSTGVGQFSADGYFLGSSAAGGSSTSSRRIIKKVQAIADNTATDVFTVTVPNDKHSAGILVTLLSSNGSTDDAESSRVAQGFVAVTRTSGANAVAVAATLTLTAIATVAAGATHTLAYGVSAISGAAGATNTFTIQVTIDDSGNLGGNEVVAIAELINSKATGVTIA